MVISQFQQLLNDKFPKDRFRAFTFLPILARSACLRYAGCEYFVSALGPSALGWGKGYLGFNKFRYLFFHTETT